MALRTELPRAPATSAACCGSCNPATSAVTPRGCCSARWWSSWRWGSWEACDEPADPHSGAAAGGIPGRAAGAAFLRAWQPDVGHRHNASDVRGIAGFARGIRPRRGGLWARPATHPGRAVDRHAQHSLPRGRRRREPMAGAAFDVPDAHLRADLLALHTEPREGVLRVSAAARIRAGGRVPGAGPVSVLRILGSLAGAHVLPDRHLGPRPPHLRRGEILPVHHDRLGADAGGHHLPLQPRADVQLPGHCGHDLERQAFLRSLEQMLLFLAFFAAFAIKVPIFPLHTWLPDAHVEAPVAGSVMLASVMLKMGTYGILHFCLPLFPSAARTCAPWIVVLAIIGIIYGALVAMVQPNMKKLVAYSSVSHLGFVVLGIFTFTQMGLDGAVYQMLNHGIST